MQDHRKWRGIRQIALPAELVLLYDNGNGGGFAPWRPLEMERCASSKKDRKDVSPLLRLDRGGFART